jgi:CHAT domain-containing protein
MTRFYQRIAAGTAPVIALREAMRDLRETHPHPYYWAPFVVTGKSTQS